MGRLPNVRDMAANDVIESVPDRPTVPYGTSTVERDGGARGESAGYVVAVVLLVLGGMLVRTFVLNWIVGPLVVVVAVALVSRSARGRVL